MKQGRKKPEKDPVLDEFEKKDLGDDIAASNSGVVIRPEPDTRIPTSILLKKDLVAKLRAKGQKRGIGYQTMLKLIVNEHIDEY